jgi:hypothetical protein
MGVRAEQEAERRLVAFDGRDHRCGRLGRIARLPAILSVEELFDRCELRPIGGERLSGRMFTSPANSVRKFPGSTSVTLTPNGVNSSLSASVQPSSVYFDAQ